jgi:Mg-chelatase subunit ChlI
LSKEIADALNPFAMRIGKQFELYGIRAKINFRSLLKALAYRNGKKAVTDAEFKEFLELADYMNFDFNIIG